MSKSNTQENASLDARYGSGTPATIYIALHKAFPGETGSGAVADYSGYGGRKAFTNNTTNFPAAAGGSKSNGAAFQFDACNGATSNDIVGWSSWDAAAAGNMLDYGVFGPAATLFTATTADVITSPGHGLAVDDKVMVISSPGGTLPGGATEGTVYYVKTVAGNDITLSATQGGASLDLTSAGAGLLQKVVSLAVSNGITPQLAVGQWTISED